MKVLIAGATGYLGSHLVDFLRSKGYLVETLSRDPQRAEKALGVPSWEFSINTPIEEKAFDGVEVVINLMGDSLGKGIFWGASKKKRLIESRIDTTKKLVHEIPKNVKTLINASAIGIYPSSGEIFKEEGLVLNNSQKFLQKLVTNWEAEADNFSGRRVLLRTGVVLGPNSEFIDTLTGVISWGLGGNLGSGQNWISWIHLHDWLRIVEEACISPVYQGPINLTSPNPVVLEDIGRSIADYLNRPYFFHVPEFMLKLLGDKKEIILANQRVLPVKAINLGFEFNYLYAEDALQQSLTSSK